jgi:hypothetical protein
VLQVPLYVLEDMVRRRDMMMLTGVAAVAALADTAAEARGTDLFASIAAGDDGPLTLVQLGSASRMGIVALPTVKRIPGWR